MTLLQERHRYLTFLPATPSSWSQTLERLFEITIQRLSRACYLAPDNGKKTTYLYGIIEIACHAKNGEAPEPCQD